MDLFASARTQLEWLRDGEVSAVELLDATLARVAEHNGDLNAIVWSDVEGARDAAAAVDAPPDDDAPLRGLPMTVKEAYDLTGSPTTWGVPLLADNTAATDSVVVERLRAAGAIVFGKTNVPLVLGDLQTYNEIYGTTSNPWDLTRSPGGSSGGSAAALAAGMTALEMGSDIGGSIRNPAHNCGVFGHKPTWGLVPSRGHSPPGGLAEPDIAVVGPLARSAADLDLALDVVAHPDRLQSGLRYELPPFGGTRGLRVALWNDDPTSPVSGEVAERVDGVGSALAELGAVVVDSARPELDPADSHRIYGALLQGFLGAAAPLSEWEATRQAAEQLDLDDTSDAAELMRAQTMSHHRWLRLHQQRERLRWAWRRFFDDIDVVVMPIAPTSALVKDEGPMSERTIIVDGVEQGYFDQLFWAGLAGVAHLPSTAIPTGLDSNGLPVGVQLVGPAFGDRVTIGTARALEASGFGFRSPPGY